MFLAGAIPYWRHFQLAFRRHHTHIESWWPAPGKVVGKA
tara:strand:+ start:348 stop:464 length:117 start_codon:yes stop_codon:yes gene_type:complete